jgi:hypothetical protein
MAGAQHATVVYARILRTFLMDIVIARGTSQN